jgi:UDP-N-acetylmuramyl pentapeptide phosphotransferase/UDP-N-acetylglucosamine-1-phosphate transferase
MILISNNQWVFSVCFLVNIFLFILYNSLAKKTNIVDQSKKFNNPVTPTSGGIVIYLNFLFFFIFGFIYEENLFINLPNNYTFTFISLTLLIVISFIDDSKPIDPKIRLFFQFLCIYVSLTSLPLIELRLPLKISILICLLIWVYIINITNFTDGVDGFLATNTVFVFLNIIFLNYYLELILFSKYISLILLPSLFVFLLFFNRPTARLYMGDVGSVLIGFINGYLFLEILIADKLNLAISLLIYPILDCSIALVKKTIQGKALWADTSNYSFLQPTKKKNTNKIFVFYTNIIFNIINSSLIFVQILFGWKFIILNILISLITMRIYEKK